MKWVHSPNITNTLEEPDVSVESAEPTGAQTASARAGAEGNRSMQQVPQSSSQRGRRPRPFSCRTMSILTCRVSRGPDSTRSAESEDNHSTRQVPQSSSQCCRHSRPLSSRTLSTLTGMATQFVEWCLPMPGAAGQQSSTCCGPSLRLGLGHPRIPGNGPHRRCDRATPGSARNLEGRRSGVHPRAGSPREARGAGSESLSPVLPPFSAVALYVGLEHKREN